jgi:hypothetical protein
LETCNIILKINIGSEDIWRKCKKWKNKLTGPAKLKRGPTFVSKASEFYTNQVKIKLAALLNIILKLKPYESV